MRGEGRHLGKKILFQMESRVLECLNLWPLLPYYVQNNKADRKLLNLII